MNFKQVPNIISIARCIIALCLIACEFYNYHLATYTYLIFFGIAFVSDALDGWLARYFNATSSIGAWLDLIADKMLFLSVWLYILNKPIGLMIQCSIGLLMLRELVVTVVRHYADVHGIAVKVQNHGKYKTIYLGLLAMFTLFLESMHYALPYCGLQVLWAMGVIASWYSFSLYIISMFYMSKIRSEIAQRQALIRTLVK